MIAFLIATVAIIISIAIVAWAEDRRRTKAYNKMLRRENAVVVTFDRFLELYNKKPENWELYSSVVRYKGQTYYKSTIYFTTWREEKKYIKWNELKEEREIELSRQETQAYFEAKWKEDDKK